MKKRLEGESRNVVIGTAMIVVAMVIVFGAVFAWMYSVDLLFLPDFMENIFGLGDDNEDTWNIDALSKIVKNGKDETGQSMIFEADYENLRKAFLSDAPARSFFLSAEISYFNGDEASSHTVRYFRSDDKFRTEIYESANTKNLSEVRIFDGEQLLISDKRSGESRVVPMGTDISAENDAGIPSVGELLAVVAEFPVSGGAIVTENPELTQNDMPTLVKPDPEIIDCEIKLIRRSDGNVYYIAFTYKTEQLRHEYFVSLAANSVISHTVSSGEKPIYSYKMMRFSTDPEEYDDASLYDAAVN